MNNADFLVRIGVYHATDKQFFEVKATSILGGALLTYYHGEVQRNHNDDDVTTMEFTAFQNFKAYCDKASANKCDLVFVIS